MRARGFLRAARTVVSVLLSPTRRKHLAIGFMVLRLVEEASDCSMPQVLAKLVQDDPATIDQFQLSFYELQRDDDDEWNDIDDIDWAEVLDAIMLLINVMIILAPLLFGKEDFNA